MRVTRYHISGAPGIRYGFTGIPILVPGVKNWSDFVGIEIGISYEVGLRNGDRYR